MAFTETWDATFKESPANSDLLGYAGQNIRETREAVEERLNVEHLWEYSDADEEEQQGRHRMGSARAFTVNTEPDALPTQSEALDSEMRGRVWCETEEDPDDESAVSAVAFTGSVKVHDGVAWKDPKACRAEVASGEDVSDVLAVSGFEGKCRSAVGALNAPDGTATVKWLYEVQRYPDGSAVCVAMQEGREDVTLRKQYDGSSWGSWVQVTTGITSAQYLGYVPKVKVFFVGADDSGSTSVTHDISNAKTGRKVLLAVVASTNGVSCTVEAVTDSVVTFNALSAGNYTVVVWYVE